MSFQGDVAGIGLGELLQGLARGGRDGVLTLFGERVSGALGLKGGVLYLLPGPDEDEESWRERSLRAWAHDPKPLMETRRRDSIARAERLESFFRMLETSNLHFRFEPGPLPAGNLTRSETEADAEPFGPGTPVEYLLLEHARLSDEASSELPVADFDMPRALDPSRFPPEVRDFLEQCDGQSTLQEIADRLGVPLRQCRAQLHEHSQNGTVRFAQPRELIAAAQKELEAGRSGRAASRLKGWVRSSPPGPPPVGDAELLITEWENGRLPKVLAKLEARDGRAILRKLDRVHLDTRAALERWRGLLDAHRTDELTILHATSLGLVSTEEPEARAFTELLRLGKSFQEAGHPQRTRTLLRLASHQLPSKPQVRVELGRRMLENDLVEEGTRWLLDVARELVTEGDGDRALAPIRAVLKRLPDHAEAHGLLIEARALIARRRRRRWKSVVAMAVVLCLSMAGLVHFRLRYTYEAQLDEIHQNLTRPDEALALLNEYFPDDDSDRVNELRARVSGLKKEHDDALRNEWTTAYEAILADCVDGDPLAGLRGALDLAPPPPLTTNRPWPERQDLLVALAGRLSERQEELDVPPDAAVEDLHAEEKFLVLLGELERIAGETVDDDATESFFYRISALRESTAQRREERAAERQRVLELRLEEKQDMLLGMARAHEQAGDLERAVATYDRLEATDDYEELRPILEAEVAAVREHWQAVQDAVTLSHAGDHPAALERLAAGCPNEISEHLLPWRVVTYPEGARATFADGRSRVTPFEIQSAPGEAVELSFEHLGFEPAEAAVHDPADLTVFLHRKPERDVAGPHLVEALPVPVGDDHILCDRSGRVRRVGRDSTVRWSLSLETLSGVARTPVFLPKNPGHLLVVSEEGQVWVVDATQGTAPAPITLEATPVRGPVLTRHGIWARLANDRIAVWDEGAQPTIYDNESSFVEGPEIDEQDSAIPSTLVALRRRADVGTELTSPWTQWTVEVRDDDVQALGPDGTGFTAPVFGAWTYVAWEAPKALLPQGRLWVGDERGVRSYRPGDGLLLRYDD